MDPLEFRDARWYALLREAEQLGVPSEDAATLVARVLAAEERRIRRADDPDPLVRAALREAVSGPSEPRRRRWPPAVAAGILALALALGTTVHLAARQDPPLADRLRSDQVPSLFGYDAATAEQTLAERGLDVHLRPFRSCEVMDRVVAVDPPTGTTYHPGDAITVYTALPADVTCLTDYRDRATAWSLLDFANGRGAAPRFADRVFVYAAGRPRAVLDRVAAADPESWSSSGVLAGLREASAEVALDTEQPPSYAVPAIRVIPATGMLGTCGVPDPSVAGWGDAFAVLVRPPDRAGCGVRLDVYLDDDAIAAVAYYPAVS